MALVISDHPDEDVDFYVPSGTDATPAIQEALQVSKIYGVAHIIIRGTITVVAPSNGDVPIVLDHDIDYLFEGDGLGEIDYVQTPGYNAGTMLVLSGNWPIQEDYQNMSTNSGVISPALATYSTNGFFIGFKNLRLNNYTNQRWMIAWGWSGIHSIVAFWDSVEFVYGANIWINETSMAVVYNCYSQSELLFDSQSREVIVLGSRFEGHGTFAVSSRGWSVIGCTFLAGAVLNPGNDGNNGNVIGCVFDGGSIVTQGAQNLKIVACTFQNVTFPPAEYSGVISYNYGGRMSIIGCTFYGFTIYTTDNKSADNGVATSVFTFAFNTFTYSSINIQVNDQPAYPIRSVVIVGNSFVSSMVFIYAWNGGQIPEFNNKVSILLVGFNTFQNSGSGVAYGVWVGPVNNNNYRLRAWGYINAAVTIDYAYFIGNYFMWNNGYHNNGDVKPVGIFNLMQMSSNIQLIKSLNFYMNVNEPNPDNPSEFNSIYLPQGQTINAQFNIGISDSNIVYT